MIFMPTMPPKVARRLYANWMLVNQPMFVEFRWMCASEEYRQFIMDIRKTYPDVMFVLDNSSYVDGKPCPWHELVTIGMALLPCTVIVPDVLNDFEMTLEMHRFVVKWRLKNPYTPLKLMFVIQGSTDREVERCAMRVAGHGFADFIGMPYRVTWGHGLMPPAPLSKEVNTLTRTNALKRYRLIHDILPLSGNTMPVHLLGLYDPYELLLYQKMSRIVSCDSRHAYLCAKYNIRYDQWGLPSGVEKPDDHSLSMEEDLTDGQFDVLLHNLKWFESLNIQNL